MVIERSLHSAMPGMRSRAFAWGGVCGHPPAAEQMNNANTALQFMLLQPGDDLAAAPSASDDGDVDRVEEEKEGAHHRHLVRVGVRVRVRVRLGLGLGLGFGLGLGLGLG